MARAEAHGRSALGIGAGMVICGVLFAACGGSVSPSAVHSDTTRPSHPRTTISPPSTTAPTTASPAGIPPAIPASGAYLGAWVHPVTGTAPSKSSFAVQMSNLPSFQQSLGRPLAIVHVYSAWATPAPIAALSAVAANGSVPLLDWGCGVPDSTVASGATDNLIRAYAQALKTYGKPVFLRWYWEMNLRKTHVSCQSAGGAADFVAAWRRIWTIFHQVGASNVAFVWCPGISGANAAPYYPGDTYVDWIGVDGYDRTTLGTTAFSALFSGFYAEWSPRGKPMMVAETGARPGVQAAYLEGAASAMTSMPQFKALVYFDAAGPTASWILTGQGVAAMAAVAKSSYFSPGPQHP